MEKATFAVIKGDDLCVLEGSILFLIRSRVNFMLANVAWTSFWPSTLTTQIKLLKAAYRIKRFVNNMPWNFL
jgi:hypothetical protein